MNKEYVNQVYQRSLELGAPKYEDFFDGNNTVKWDEVAFDQVSKVPLETDRKLAPKTKEIKDILNTYKTKKVVLDLGCGTGILSYSIPLSKSYIGIDQNDAMLTFAEQRAPHGKFYLSPLTQVTKNVSDLIGQIDILITCTVLQHNHLLDISKTLEEIYSLLKPDGIYVAKEAIMTPSTYTEEVRIKYHHPEIDFDTETGSVAGGYFTSIGWQKFFEVHDFKVLKTDLDNHLFILGK
jgi:2-polyprenyl-3-methyl-5-hydroxy-6-metoxy-1,4-benzoquinol methylase